MKWLDALGLSESYQVPDAMMKALMDGTKRHELFSLYLSEFSLDDDPVNVLFQEEHGDRGNIKQDTRARCTSITSSRQALSILLCCSGCRASKKCRIFYLTI